MMGEGASMKKLSLCILVCLLSLSLFGQAQKEKTCEGATYTDSIGNTVRLSPVSKVISLGPNVTETICALGAEEMLIGRTDYCNYPQSIVNVPSVGSLFNPSLETIIAMKPDMVIASSLIDDKILTKLKDAGIQVLCINKQQSFEGTYEMISDIGLVIGKIKEAKTLVEQMKAKAASVVQKYKGYPLVSVYVAISYGSFDSTATGDTFISEMIELCHATNIAKDAVGWIYNKEKLITSNPQVIIITPDEGQSRDEALAQWKSTKPYSDLEGKVMVMDADLLSRQGPRSADALRELASLIHSEAAL